MFDYSGNVINPIWFGKITTKKGGADMLAINILADVIYRHTPTIQRDEKTGLVISSDKKFKADKLQKSYQDYATLFGYKRDTIKRAFDKLDEVGVIKREFRNIKIGGYPLNNVMYLSLDKEVLQELNSRVSPLKTPPPPPQNEGDEYIDYNIDYINTNLILSKDNTTDVDYNEENEKNITEDIALSIEKDNNIDEAITKTKKEAIQKKEAKVFGNRDISEICQKFRSLCEEHGLAYNSTNERKAAKRLTGKPFFTDKIAVSGCEDLLCYIESIFTGNQKLGEYAYSIGGPQPFFYNAEKVYNRLKMSGKWNSESNPAKLWFEEFYNLYPKKEGKEHGLSWYLTFIKGQEEHERIMTGTKNFIEFIKKEGRSLEYVKSANKYLTDGSWKDYLVDEVPDDIARQHSYEMGDANIFKEHLKLKYGTDWAMSHGAEYQELKIKIVEKSRTD